MIGILVGAIFFASSTPPELQAYASSVAIENGLNKDHFLATLNCESGFRYNAIGDDGASIGVAQIYLRFHPDISRKQAMDPYYAIEWMAHAWEEGHASWWTCWRERYE